MASSQRPFGGRPEWSSARARRFEVGGPGVARVGAALIVVGLVTVAATHGVGPWPWTAGDEGVLLPMATGVLVVLAATAVGASLLVDAAQAPSRHVFCFRSLRRVSLVMTALGLVYVVVLFRSEFFSNVWSHGETGGCEIACVGVLTAALTCFVFAAVAARLAWHAYLTER